MFAVVLYFVDKKLRVLNAYTNGKGFGFEQPTMLVEQVEDVASRVSGGKQDGLALHRISVVADNATDLSVVDNKV